MNESRQVLLVEDEALVASLVTDMLDELGYGVVGAATAEAALELAATDIDGIDLAIVDLGLPDRGGDELVEDLRALRCDLPIVVATGYDEVKSSARFAGMDRLTVIRKPYTSEHLRAAIESLAQASTAGNDGPS